MKVNVPTHSLSPHIVFVTEANWRMDRLMREMGERERILTMNDGGNIGGKKVDRERDTH